MIQQTVLEYLLGRLRVSKSTQLEYTKVSFLHMDVIGHFHTFLVRFGGGLVGGRMGVWDMKNVMHKIR